MELCTDKLTDGQTSQTIDAHTTFHVGEVKREQYVKIMAML